MRFRSLAGLLLLLLGSSATALLAAEALGRLFIPEWQPRRAERGLFWQHHPTLGWSHKPGATGRFVGPGWNVEVRINPRGLRDVDHDYERVDPARKRMLLLGDSFAWGFGVEQDEMLSAVLRRSCPGWEVINGSVSGYSTDQEILWYRNEGSRYGPDVVLLLIHENDLEGNSVSRIYGYEKPAFALTEEGLRLQNVPVPPRSFVDRAYGWLMNHSHLANGITLSWSGLAYWFESERTSGAGGPTIRPRITGRLVGHFASMLRESDVELHLVLIPMEPRYTTFFQQVAEAARVPVTDLSVPFRRAEMRGERLMLDGDPHWNAQGHRLAANAIAAELCP